VKVIIKYLGVTEQEAKEHIAARQADRDKFTRHFTKMGLADPHLYHLLINNEKHSTEEMADIIMARIDSFPASG
jgi:cytidylate kinase